MIKTDRVVLPKINFAEAQVNLPYYVIAGTVVLFLFWLVLNIFFGERVFVNNGLGWDGSNYANIAINFSDLVFHKHLSQYHLHRIFPSGIIYFGSKLSGFPVTKENVIFMFSVYNTILLCIAVGVWWKIAKNRSWNVAIQIISFSGLFLNFAILKMNTYYPILTDTTAFVFGLLIIYFFINNQQYFVLLMSIFSFFIFPILPFIGLILFIFPKKTFSSNKINIWLSVIQAIIISAIVIFIYWITKCQVMGGYYEFPSLFFSALGVFIFFYCALKPISSYYSFQLSDELNFYVICRAILALSIAYIINQVIYFLSDGSVGALTAWGFINNLVAEAMAYPLNFLIAHVLYFGPIICLIVYFWSELVASIKDFGFGIFLLTGSTVVLSIASESRQLIMLLPFYVVLISEVLCHKKFYWHKSLLFALFSVITSKAWLPINYGVENWTGGLLDFPMQWYFMNQGPWVSPLMYVINLILVMIIFIIMYRFSRTFVSSSPRLRS